MAAEWHTPEEAADNNETKRLLHRLRHGRPVWQEVKTKESREDFNYNPLSVSFPMLPLLMIESLSLCHLQVSSPQSLSQGSMLQ
jgi:hypothetical protein